MFRVGPDPFRKLGTASDVRNTVNVAKIQGQNAELVSVSLEFMNVLLGAPCNTVVLLRWKTRWRVDVGVLFRSVVSIVCRNTSIIVPKQYC
jgi:hypothetical protein